MAEAIGNWISLGDQAEGFVVADTIVAVIYSEDVGPVDEGDEQSGTAYELWWIPVDELTAREVLFGVGDLAGDASETRWERARRAGEWLYSERLSDRSSGGI
jgi:hypothetical protein